MCVGQEREKREREKYRNIKEFFGGEEMNAEEDSKTGGWRRFKHGGRTEEGRRRRTADHPKMKRNLRQKGAGD